MVEVDFDAVVDLLGDKSIKDMIFGAVERVPKLLIIEVEIVAIGVVDIRLLEANVVIVEALLVDTLVDMVVVELLNTNTMLVAGNVLGVELIDVVILFVVEMLFIDAEIIGDVNDRELVVILTELVVEVEVVVILNLDWKDGVDVITEFLHGLLIPSSIKSWIKENQNCDSNTTWKYAF